MKTWLGNALGALGVVALLVGFGWRGEESDWALATRMTGVALAAVGVGLRCSASATGRIWVGVLGMALFIPGLVALPLFAYLRADRALRLSVSWEMWLFLGLVTAGGSVLAAAGAEKSVALADQQQRLHANLALLFGSANTENGIGTRARAKRVLWLVVLLLELGLGIWWAELNAAQVPLLLLSVWLVGHAVVALHELAHLFCARAVGYQVINFTVGDGPAARFNVGSVQVVLGVLPGPGHVQFSCGAVPAWRGLRSVAWAGPISGLIPLLFGAQGMLAFARNSVAFGASVVAVVCAVVSIGQLIPERNALTGEYTDGIWLFLPEAVVRQILAVRMLTLFQLGVPAPERARAVLPRLADAWQLLHLQRDEIVPTHVLAALAYVKSVSAAATTVEDEMSELFLFGMLVRMSLADDDLRCLADAIDAYCNGPATPLFRTRVLDFANCALLYPPRSSSLELVERWARRAVELLPDDPTLYGTLGSALIERGEKAEGQRHLKHVIQHSRVARDRRLARAQLSR